MSPETLVQKVSELVSLPSVVARINELVDDPKSSAADIGDLVVQDPGLTAKVLQIANSAIYGLPYQIDTVSRAVTLLGTQQLWNIVVATACVDTFQKIPNELMSMEDFWRHSMYCGLVSKALGKMIGFRDSESLFIGGLLHDIGVLTMFRLEPDNCRRALEMRLGGSEGLEIQAAEQKIFGFDHADVGGALLKKWKFPVRLTEMVAYHHYPHKAREFIKETSIVHIANSIAVLTELNSDDMTFAPSISESAWQITGLNLAQIHDVREQANEQFQECLSVFLPGTGSWPNQSASPHFSPGGLVN